MRTCRMHVQLHPQVYQLTGCNPPLTDLYGPFIAWTTGHRRVTRSIREDGRAPGASGRSARTWLPAGTGSHANRLVLQALGDGTCDNESRKHETVTRIRPESTMTPEENRSASSEQQPTPR